MKFLKNSLLASVIIALGSFSAQAKDIDGSDPEAVFEIAKGYGNVELETDEYGDPQITGRYKGDKFIIWFYECDDGKDCESVSFSAAWVNNGSVDVDMINAWNRDMRFSRAYIDDEGDPNLDWDVNLVYGVSEDNFDNTLSVWFDSMEEFVDYIDD